VFVEHTAASIRQVQCYVPEDLLAENLPTADICNPSGGEVVWQDEEKK
jgi:hypothetical protein